MEINRLRHLTQNIERLQLWQFYKSVKKIKFLIIICNLEILHKCKTFYRLSLEMSLPVITGKPSQTEVSAGFKYPAVLLAIQNREKQPWLQEELEKAKRFTQERTCWRHQALFFCSKSGKNKQVQFFRAWICIKASTARVLWTVTAGQPVPRWY